MAGEISENLRCQKEKIRDVLLAVRIYGKIKRAPKRPFIREVVRAS